MNFFNLSYFKDSDSLCGDDFKRQRRNATINLHSISSVKPLVMFSLPLSGTNVGWVSIVTMNTGDKFAIDEDAYSDLNSALNDLI